MKKAVSTKKFKKKIQQMGFQSHIFIGVHDDKEGTNCLVDWRNLGRVQFEFKETLLKNKGENFPTLKTMINILAASVIEAASLLKSLKKINVEILKDNDGEHSLYQDPINNFMNALPGERVHVTIEDVGNIKKRCDENPNLDAKEELKKLYFRCRKKQIQ